MTLGRPLVLALAACSVPDVDYTGKQCPCPVDYSCDNATHTCVRGALAPDGATGDGATGDGAAASCLPDPLMSPQYSTATFADFGMTWSTAGGIWDTNAAELEQTSTVSSFAVAYYTGTPSYGDVHLVGAMHAISAGAGDAIELALRIDADNTHLYHCNWEPADGGFLIQRTDNITTTPVIQMTMIALDGRPVDASVIMEFQAKGNEFTCCLRGIAGALISGTDMAYAAGAVGVKTYEASAGFSSFHVYTQ